MTDLEKLKKTFSEIGLEFEEIKEIYHCKKEIKSDTNIYIKGGEDHMGDFYSMAFYFEKEKFIEHDIWI